MPYDHDDVFNSGGMQIVKTTFNHRGVAEGQQRLERAHAARAPGGEKDRGYLISGLWSLVFELFRTSAHVDEENKHQRPKIKDPAVLLTRAACTGVSSVCASSLRNRCYPAAGPCCNRLRRRPECDHRQTAGRSTLVQLPLPGWARARSRRGRSLRRSLLRSSRYRFRNEYRPPPRGPENQKRRGGAASDTEHARPLSAW